jgi:hypothetical protein
VADAGLRWCGATPLSTERRISNVKGCEEIIICFDCSRRCHKPLAAGSGPDHEPETQFGLQAIPRHCDAAITSRSNDCGYDEGHRLATALGSVDPNPCSMFVATGISTPVDTPFLLAGPALLIAEKVNLAISASKDGKLRVVYQGWDDPKTVLDGQVLEVRWGPQGLEARIGTPLAN